MVFGSVTVWILGMSLLSSSIALKSFFDSLAMADTSCHEYSAEIPSVQ